MKNDCPVQIILLTNGHVGTALLAAARQTFEVLPLPVAVLSVSGQCNTQHLEEELLRLVEQNASIDTLILTDLYGSTPCNIAQKIAIPGRVKVVAGANLPMLLRVLNYAHLPLAALATKALSGGQDGVIEASDRTA